MLKAYLAAIVVCLLLIPAKSFAFEEGIKSQDTSISVLHCQTENAITSLKIDVSSFGSPQCAKTPNEQVAGRGCCSHHGGVCGCSSDGRAQCCDGGLSPSCGC